MRSGESQRVLDETQGEHRQPARDQGRRQPAGQPQRVAQQCRCEHQHRPVPQIPRVGHPADRAHRRHCQDAAASLRRCGTAGADHQRSAQHGQQRGGTRIGCVGLNRVQASRISPSPAHPMIAAGSAGSRRHWPAVRATRPPTANCHARVGSEKNATKETTSYVINSDSANDTAATSARTTRYGRFDEVARASVARCRADAHAAG